MKNGLCVLMLRTPIGQVKVVHTSLGVKEICLDRDYNENDDITGHRYKDLDVKVVSHEGEWQPSIESTIDWLKAFFSKQTTRKTSLSSSLPNIDNEIYTKNNFTGRVLRTLANGIKYGSTVSYAQLAKLCESPKACRAVGQAMRANPVPLIVPCHRVISSSGTSGHYMSGKGDNIKKWLIEFEQKF